MQTGDEATIRQVKVWDLFIRFFHWSLVAGVTVCFISGLYGYATIHTWVGYSLSVLLIARLVRGLLGRGHARFSSFTYGPVATLRYLASLRNKQPMHFIGHNPAGAQMVFTLLISLSLLLLTGMATLATIDFEGPLLFINRWVDDLVAYRLQYIHECMPWVLTGFITLHVVGVATSSIIHRENLVRSMFTGIKDIPPGITPQDQHRTKP